MKTLLETGGFFTFTNMVFEINKIREVENVLSNASSVVIIGHKSPDGDAIGSCLALKGILSSKYAGDYHVIVPDNYPDFLSWMEGIDDVIVASDHIERATDLISSASVIFTLDFNNPSRVGKGLEQSLADAEGVKIMIDHHREPSDYCKYTFSDISSCSTAQMIYEFAEALNLNECITPGIAEALYCGIMTDTGSFKFSSTAPKTHRIAAILMESGCNHEKVHRLVYDANTVERVKLLGYALNKMDVKKEYELAILHLSSDELKRFNAKKGDTEGFVNYALSMEGISVAIFAKETDEGVKMSFRSKGDCWVNELASKHFNGGGHKNAAGGISFESIESTLEKIESLLPELIIYKHD